MASQYMGAKQHEKVIPTYMVNLALTMLLGFRHQSLALALRSLEEQRYRGSRFRAVDRHPGSTVDITLLIEIDFRSPHAPAVNPSRLLPSLLTCAVLIAFAGCIHEPTRAERAASFARHAEVKIAGKPAADFLFARTVRVLTLSSVPLGPRLRDNGTMGTAAMIDPQGYFLTAAHCLAGEQVDLVFEHVGREFVVPARIVWRGNPHNGGADLALLHAPGLPLKSFHWAPETPSKFAPVLAVGQNTTDTGGAVTACIAGRFLGSSPARFVGLSGTWINHSAPLHGGDSGGPLVTTDGALIGINVHSRSVLPLLPPALRGGSVALRPDVAQIKRLIRADRARASEAVPPAGTEASLSRR